MNNINYEEDKKELLEEATNVNKLSDQVVKLRDLEDKLKLKEEELKKKEDHYAALAESGEPILVVKPDGNKYLMVPEKPDDMRHLWDHDDGA